MIYSEIFKEKKLKLIIVNIHLFTSFNNNLSKKEKILFWKFVPRDKCKKECFKVRKTCKKNYI